MVNLISLLIFWVNGNLNNLSAVIRNVLFVFIWDNYYFVSFRFERFPANLDFEAEPRHVGMIEPKANRWIIRITRDVRRCTRLRWNEAEWENWSSNAIISAGSSPSSAFRLNPTARLSCAAGRRRGRQSGGQHEAVPPRRTNMPYI